MSQIKFLHTQTILWLCFAVAAQGHAMQDTGFSLGIAVGDTSSSSAILWTRADRGGQIRCEVATSPSFDSPLQTQLIEVDDQADRTVRALFSGLTPGADYFYRFIYVDGSGESSRVGRFRTTPMPNTAAAGRFVFSGDTNYAYAPFGVVNSIANENADAFIWFGDTIYADVTAGGLGPASTLDEYRAKYRQVRSDPSVQEALASTAIWVGGDDHEVRNDYAGTDPNLSPSQKSAGLQAFFDYMPLTRQNLPGDEFRTYRSFRWGANAEFFFLDARQYREPSALAACGGNPDPTGFILGPLTRDGDCIDDLRIARNMLGDAQLTWLMNGLRNSTATVKFVVNNVPLSFIGIYPYDRWDGYDAQRRELLEFIDGEGIANVVFLTTDIHANALNPDVGAFFRRFRPDYSLGNQVSVVEVIAGPLGNETLSGTLTGFGSTNLTAGLPSLGGLLALGEQFLEGRLREVNGLTFLESNRVSYVVIDVAEDGSWKLTYRGLVPERANEPETAAETLFDGVPTVAPTGCGCGMLPVSLTAVCLFVHRRAWNQRTRHSHGANH